MRIHLTKIGRSILTLLLATSAIACGGDDDGGGVDAATFDAPAGGDASGGGDAAPAAGLVGFWSFEDDLYELSADGTFTYTRPGEATVGTYTFDARTIVLEGRNADSDESTMTVTYALTEDGRLGLMALHADGAHAGAAGAWVGTAELEFRQGKTTTRLGGDVRYQLDADGTATKVSSFLSGEPDETMVGTYVVAGAVVTVTFEEESATDTFTLADDALMRTVWTRVP